MEVRAIVEKSTIGVLDVSRVYDKSKRFTFSRLGDPISLGECTYNGSHGFGLASTDEGQTLKDGVWSQRCFPLGSTLPLNSYFMLTSFSLIMMF